MKQYIKEQNEFSEFRKKAEAGELQKPKEKIVYKVYVLKEAVLASWAKDIVTFTFLFGAIWLNHNHFGGSWLLNFFFFWMLFAFPYSKMKRKSLTIPEVREELERLEPTSE